MEAIIITREISGNEENFILQKLNNGSKFYVQPGIKLPVSLNKFKYFAFELGEEKKKKINFEVLDEVLQFGEVMVNGQALTDFLKYETISFWHYFKFRAYFEVRNLYYELSLLNDLKDKYDHIFFFTGKSRLKNYLNHNNITFKLLKTQTGQYNYLQIFKYFTFFFSRILTSSLKNQHLNRKEHLIIDHTKPQAILDPETLKLKKANYNLFYLFKKIDHRFIILNDINFPEKKKNYTFSFQGISLMGKDILFGEQVILSGLLSSSARKELKTIKNFLQGRLNKIQELNFNDTQRIILDSLMSKQKEAILYILKYVAYKRFFKKYAFKSITTIDENSPRIKSILDAAKFSGIKTIGIQHGTIHELHPAYRFTEKDTGRNIVTDKTLVWGHYWNDLLINRFNYPKNSVFITGQIRTDIIPVLLSNQEKVRKLTHIEEPYALFATQPQRDPEQRRQVTEIVFKSFTEIKDLKLIVKLHPAELNDVSYYQDIASSVGLTNYEIRYWDDLYLLLSQSKMVITAFSTVGAEAIYFKKPLIIIDPLLQDIQGYKRSGVAFQVKNERELTNYVNNILVEKLIVNNDAYSRFINEFAYKIDGQVCKRIIEFITQI